MHSPAAGTARALKRPPSLLACVLVLGCLNLVRSLAADHPIPVIKANSKVVTIIDGVHVKTNYWHIMPEKNPDVYYVEIPTKRNTVRFTTDRESISFELGYGEVKDFDILLNDSQLCRTQIRALIRDLKPSQRNCGECAREGQWGRDEIPIRPWRGGHRRVG